MQLFLKTPASQEPLTLEEAKTYLRISSDQEDEFLKMLMAAARSHVESFTGRALLKQQWGLHIKPPYPEGSPLVKREGKRLEIALPRPPLLEVMEVKASAKTIAYEVEENRVLLSSLFWDKEISIIYWAGYGETAASLPPDLKMAVLMATRFFYDNQKVDLPLLGPYKVFHLG
ncbi:MAG: phage head-tail connector protein [Alphaproteobacteria bacterium]|nr:phage head-tail connector protein [Alphaproteobacteria bacterium]